MHVTQRNIEGYRSRFQDQESAERYATRFERGRRRVINTREQRAVAEIFGGLPDSRSVLDVPCGAGRFQAVLSGNRREVIGMDVAVEILGFGLRRAAQAGLRGQFMAGDASRLPLRDGAVDVVFSNRLLHHITASTERLNLLREFRRVTRGYAIVSFFDYLAFGRLRAFLKSLKGRQVDYAGQPTLAEFCSECEKAGFAIAKVVPTGPPWVSQKYLLLAAGTRVSH